MAQQTSRRSAMTWLIAGLVVYLAAMLTLLALHATNDVAAAVGAWAGAIAVLITAYLAYTQLADLRRSAAFDSFMRAIAIFESREFSSAVSMLVHASEDMNPFPKSFADLATGPGDKYQREKLSDAIRFLLNTFERTGVLYKYGHLDEELLMRLLALEVVQIFDHIESFAVSERQSGPGQLPYENAFYLNERCSAYLIAITKAEQVSDRPSAR